MDQQRQPPQNGFELRDDHDGGSLAPQRQPVFNLPPALAVTIALIAVLYALESLLLGPEGQSAMLFYLAFTPLRYVYPLTEQGLEWLWTPVTYSLLHGGMEHILFNTLWLLAFGTPVVRRIGTIRYVLFWATSAAAAAFFHAALNWGDQTILIGASGVVSALMGAACRFAFPSRGGLNRLYGHLYPRQTILGSFRNRTVVVFTALWLLGNLLIAVGLPLVGGGEGAIAWDAHIGGFLFGFLLFGFFDPLPMRAWPDQEQRLR
ncbi:membrane associated rhomboid family serine protease [Pseudorhizobium tarimense]|uniref:Membrane associated rhomboid family serine protease n=1 Tax=Pseudorhizobium tarimense TaxID=1079109 RepID=A0ABV2HCC8_9HYPH|nr:rhomboid family intramembrane serine protease [Pseudorhizobium tarimense]MCJ8521248.1 rhomboid family intramembrane serine protease [Pseudorhizobium tarimense]